jgi:hypothetical protein
VFNSISNRKTRFATSIILRIAYGFGLKDSDKEYMEITAEVARTADNSGTGGTLIDLFPFRQLLYVLCVNLFSESNQDTRSKANAQLVSRNLLRQLC